MKLITISGLDGSGKSTQIQLLKNYLEHTGSKVFYFHAVEFSLANKLAGKKNNIGKPPQSMHWCGGKSVTHASAFQIWLRKIFLRIDIWRFRLLRSKLRNKGYNYILSDRYFYDSVINIEYLEKNIRREQKILFPNADVAIYLQTDPEIIMQRERKPDQGIEYLKKKKELYDAKISQWNLQVINGNQDKNIIFEEIKCQI